MGEVKDTNAVKCLTHENSDYKKNGSSLSR